LAGSASTTSTVGRRGAVGGRGWELPEKTQRFFMGKASNENGGFMGNSPFIAKLVEISG